MVASIALLGYAAAVCAHGGELPAQKTLGRVGFLPYSLCLITVLPYLFRVKAGADDLEPRRPTVNMAANPAYSGKAALPEIDERTGDLNS